MNTAVYPYQISGADINVTPVAQQQMSNLMVDMEENIQGIRIFVTGGGCSGMTYAMTFANTINDYDSVLECEGFKIIVDPIALNYLQGCLEHEEVKGQTFDIGGPEILNS